MADESDSGSVHSNLSEQNADKKAPYNNCLRFYALYSFYPNRSNKHGNTTPDAKPNEDECNFSLSIAATNLSASAETDLRRCLANKLSKGSYMPGSGNFLSLGISSSEDISNSAVCYYNVLSCEPIEIENNGEPEYKQFVVCFVSFSDSSLDLFRFELDTYCKGITKLLDAELSQIDTNLKDYLDSWHQTVLEYLTRCVKRLNKNIHYLIFSSLLDAQLIITGATPQEEEDINKFVQCCSIAPLVEQLRPELDDNLVDIRNQPIIKLNLDKDSVTFDTNGNIPSQFCRLAGEHLLTIESQNITKLRDSLESVKLAFIHNLNKVKRFLKQAEIDHYALYRSYLYLRKCGSGELLIRYVKIDATSETLSVLKTLEEFIQKQGHSLQ
ncbi:protein Njmu-R1 isoform X2 [Patella vulgata]|uniref:protein Njmu-R1 isoform X2 n=1 Tax=Patella vulgata TaxID=6465 RepID=UPI0024A7AA7D|nr:protein Njmu-R1 isoform X2 [Patella vulgata]